MAADPVSRFALQNSKIDELLCARARGHTEPGMPSGISLAGRLAARRSWLKALA
jgi:hypothetical protein